jgi:hypothetical protein
VTITDGVNSMNKTSAMILEYFNRLKPLLLAAIAGFLWYSAFPPMITA